MRAVTAVLLFASVAAPAVLSTENMLLDSMDAVNFQAPKEKGRVEQVDGKDGKALKFTFDDNCRNVYFYGRVRGTAEWDKAAGFSFWVKGDGSDKLGGHRVRVE